jgi:hypothetical protein
MRKELFLAIISLALAGILITSCATAPPVKYYVCSDGRQVLDAAQCAFPAPLKEEPEAPPVFEEEEAEPVKVILSDAVKALFDKSAKAKSMQFYYVESPNTMPDNKYYMTREKMRIELKVMAKYGETEAYDIVYLDLVNKRGVGYCEEKGTGYCADNNLIYDVDYNDYMIITPFEWLDRITWADVTGKSKMIDNRNAVEVSFKVKENTGSMFVDAFFGIPMIVTYNGKTFDYRSITMNQVDEETLEHQLIT